MPATWQFVTMKCRQRSTPGAAPWGVFVRRPQPWSPTSGTRGPENKKRVKLNLLQYVVYVLGYSGGDLGPWFQHWSDNDHQR